MTSGEPLQYTIRFQNTGTYYAENVRILDTISTNLDLSSLQILSSSHPVEWFVRNKNLLEFVFANILLPDSTKNEPDSHGFVKFSLRPKKNLKIGQWLENKADIYFDFNSSIRTNTASILISNNSSTIDLKNTLSLAVSPNPNRGNFIVTLPNSLEKDGLLEVFDQEGKTVNTQVWEKGLQTMLIKMPITPSGIYFVRLKSGHKTWLGKAVIQR